MAPTPRRRPKRPSPTRTNRPRKASSTSFEVLDHTADIGLEAEGPDLKGAFEEAARGMFSLIVDPETVSAGESRPVVVCGTDVEDLLMSWLNELIYLHETEGLLLTEFDIGKFDPVAAELEATVRGEVYDPERHELELGVKASTFNGLEVLAGPPARATVYFDV